MKGGGVKDGGVKWSGVHGGRVKGGGVKVKVEGWRVKRKVQRVQGAGMSVNCAVRPCAVFQCVTCAV